MWRHGHQSRVHDWSLGSQPARACAQHSPTNKSDPVGKKKVRKNHPDQQAVKTNDDFDMTGDQSVHQSHPSVDTASYDKGS